MAVPYHTHTFEIPIATKQDMAARAANDKVVTPSVLGTAATADVSQFATAGQGKKADSAVQPESLKSLAYKDKITVDEISTNGVPSSTTFLSGDGWQNLTGGGDMLASLYDPSQKQGDAFDMANMKEADNAKILTAAERDKLEKLKAELTAADIAETDKAKILTADERKLLANFKDQVLDQMVDGSIIMCPFAKPAYRMIIANGALLRRKDYSLLWSVVSQLGTVSEKDWLNGQWGAYSVGDGSTTFRIPNLSGEFPRFLDTIGSVDKSRKAGSAQGDAIRNITGTFGEPPWKEATIYEWSTGAGVFRGLRFTKLVRDLSTIRALNTEQEIFPIGYDFDASRQVPTANENRPHNIALLPCIRY
ncbi:phage tail protein [uncultured Bartonella sp.]|uniref:phage tail protein n=1 Tax=uncultured Bartonella sp. TaxID=104108 RepID=UPI0026075D66|nr:phage tail protein [uncultured Bartonella sp.]